MPRIWSKRLIFEFFMDKWGVRWRHLTTYRQTKLWIASMDCLGKNIPKLDSRPYSAGTYWA